MLTKTNFIFIVLLILSWLIFVGLGIEAGGLIVNFFFSIYRPDFVGNLYQTMDLTGLYRDHPNEFYKVYSFILVIAILKTYLFYIVVMLMHRIDLKKPFNPKVAKEIMQLSYFTLTIGLLSVLAQESTKKTEMLLKNSVNLQQFWIDGEAFILTGAIIYIIATIFKKGVDLQTENDLTV